MKILTVLSIISVVVGKEQQCEWLASKFALEDLNTVVDTSHKQLVGTWLSKNCETRTGPQYLLRAYTFREDGTYKLIQHHYWDSSCSLPKLTITSTGLLRLTRNLIYNPDAAIGFVRPVNITLIPQGAEAAEELQKIVENNCPDIHWQQWIKYDEYLLHDTFLDNYLYNDSKNFIMRLSCLGNLKWTFSELKFIKIQIRPIYSDISENPTPKFHKLELLLGDAVSEDSANKFSASRGFQQPLIKWTQEHKILAHGRHYKIKNVCGICENLQRNDKIPPHLLKQPELPPYIEGDWISVRCEIRSMGFYLTRKFSFIALGSETIWIGGYKIYLDPFCGVPKFSVNTVGDFTLLEKNTFQPDATDINLNIRHARLTIYDRKMSEEMSKTNACNIDVWEVDIPYSIRHNYKCTGLNLIVPSTQYEIVKLDISYEGSSLLYLGLMDGDGFPKVTQKRPTSYSEPLIRCASSADVEDNWKNLLYSNEMALKGNNSSHLEFTWVDYGFFSSTLLLSLLIGVYFGFIQKQTTVTDYLLGGKEMSAAPIAMSLISSLISGLTVLAVPTDVYHFGVTYWWSALMLLLCMIFSYYYCIPIFYELQVTSTYEYLEKRFDSKIRKIASALFAVTMFFYLPIVTYVPAMALSQATNFNIHAITPLICGICVFYTTFGGLKAVVWTDAFQFVIMIGASVVILFLAIPDAGGLENIWRTSAEHGRLNISMELDITKRDTFWTGTVGAFFIWFAYACCNQGLMQKCISLPNYKTVRNALVPFTLGTTGIITFSVFCGLIMFTKYHDCDPLSAGKINTADQLLPYYIMDIGKALPGLPGLFTASVFSAGLSTLSAQINCLSATVYEDFLAPFVKQGISEKTISNYLKVLSVAIGIITIALVFFVPYMGNLLPLSVSFGGITSGTTLGIFASGMFFPSINARGVLCGSILAFLCLVWIIMGSQYYRLMNLIKYPHLPLLVHGCQNPAPILNNVTLFENNSVLPEEEPSAVYKISFYYYALIGMAITIVTGLIISKFTPQHNKSIPKKYFSPLIRGFIPDADVPPDYYTIANEGLPFKPKQ
ncbi:hypothetical protein Trydic_g17021 [Trypoxylus dichotomus]